MVLLALAIECGDPAGTGGSGGDGDALTKGSAYGLSCAIDTLVLNIPIELSYELDRPYVEGGSAELTLSATVTFTEQASTALIDAGIDKVDIILMQSASGVAGATPATVETSLAAAPINDFDLEPDTKDYGLPGPHRVELYTATVAPSIGEGAEVVELSLGLDNVLLRLW